MTHREPHCVIVGGGQSARWLLFALAEQLVSKPSLLRGMRITVVERQQEFGVGLAWNRCNVLEAHLASRASLLTRWDYGDRQKRQFAGTVEFLRESGSQVQLLPGEEAVDMVERSEGFELSLRSGPRISADYVVLATGYGTPPWHGKVRELEAPAFAGSPGVHASPWPARQLQDTLFAAAGSRRILLLGSYLTAVDTALTLALRAGHFREGGNGRLVYEAPADFHLCMASRCGLLPKVSGREPTSEWELRRFTTSSLQRQIESTAQGEFLPMDTALRLLGEELACAALQLDGRTPASLQHLARPARRLSALRRVLKQRDAGEILRGDISEVMSTGLPYGSYDDLRACGWQAPLDRAIAVWNEASPWFSAEDVTRFEVGLRTVFFNHMLPLTLHSALQLDALLRSGHLRLIALGSSYRLAAREAGEARYQLRYDVGTREREELFDHIVDATGHPGDLQYSRSSLLQGLLRRGLIQPALRAVRDPARDATRSTVFESGGRRYLRTSGVYANPRTCEAIPAGEVDSAYARGRPAGLYVVGPNLAGQFADSQSVGQAQRDARRVVADLLRKQTDSRAEFPWRTLQ
jgi:uncharacterized NAD(P)/FAD-binding protein YdhS